MKKPVADRPRKVNTFAATVGGNITQTRREEVAQGKWPRIDVLEMESDLDAQLYDLGWLARETEHSRLARFVQQASELTGRESAWLALQLLWTAHDDAVVYATGEDVGLPLAALLRLFRRKSPRLILRLEEPIQGQTAVRRFLFDTYLRFAMKRIDLTLCRTNAHIRYLHDMGVTSALTLLPEPKDTHFWSQTAAEKARLTMNLPFRANVVSAGLEMRDYVTLIAAVRELPVKVVIGAGSPWSKFSFDGGKADSLPPNVHVASFTPVEMRELYLMADLVVVPVLPTMRSCGISVVLEGWAMQRPVIASRTVGLQDYVQDGHTGLFVEPGDVAAMRTGIQRLLARPEEAARLAQAGREHVVANFGLERYVDWVAAAVTDVLA